MNFMHQIWAIVWKDLTSELRTKEHVLTMGLFSCLVLVIFNFSFETGVVSAKKIIPGILWVAFLFSGLIGLNRAFGTEKDRGTLAGLYLCPVSPWGIYLAKLIGTLLLTVSMEVITLLLFVVLYNLNIMPFILSLSIVIFLGTLGFCSVGTIFSAIAAATRTRDKILAILVFPIAVPMVIASVKATAIILDGKPLPSIQAWLKILIAFDAVFLLLAYLTFGFIMEE